MKVTDGAEMYRREIKETQVEKKFDDDDEVDGWDRRVEVHFSFFGRWRNVGCVHGVLVEKLCKR